MRRLRELLTGGLLDDALSGKSDESARFRRDHVAVQIGFGETFFLKKGFPEKLYFIT